MGRNGRVPALNQQPSLFPLDLHAFQVRTELQGKDLPFYKLQVSSLPPDGGTQRGGGYPIIDIPEAELIMAQG